MKRPIILFVLSLICGILYGYLTRSYLFLLIIILLFPIAFFICHKFYQIKLFILIGFIFFFSVGAFEFIFVNNSGISKFSEYSGHEVTVKGYIADEPDISETKINYIIKTSRIKYKNTERKINGKILLTELKVENIFIYSYGSEIEINGQLCIPQGKRNPGGFDYQRYLLQSGVSATIFAKSYNIKVGSSKRINPAVILGLGIRNRIIETIEKTLPGEQAGLLNGMLIGYTKGIDKSLQTSFSDAGLSHIMAVSGMNVAFIVFPLAFLLKKAGVRKKPANIFIILTLILFVFITGFSPSVVRAAIMAAIVLMGQILYREADALTSLSAAAFILLIYNPLNLFNIGFQLSFLATLSLMLFYKRLYKIIDFKYIPKLIKEMAAVTIAAQLGVLPVIIYFFNKVSLISIITNILVVPLTGIVTILGFLTVIIGQFSIAAAQLLAYINYSFLTFILFVTKTAANLPLSTIKVITPNLFVIFIYFLIIFFFLWYKPRKGIKLNLKHLTAILFLCLIIFVTYILYPRNLTVVFLDVGEGDSTFIRTPSGKTVLIDGGGSPNSKQGNNPGEKTIIPFLLDYGVQKLDLVIATHGHDDHIQGLKPILEDFRVYGLIMPCIERRNEFKDLIKISDKKGVRMDYCEKGESIKLDKDTYIDILHPSKGFKVNKESLNNSSLVLKLHYKKISMIFTGDAENEVEELLVSGKGKLDADVIKIAHHGSQYSTSQKLLDKINPLVAVISVGKNNYGHPSQEVIERLENKNIDVLRTDKNGGIVVKSDGNVLKVKKTIN